MAAIAGDERPSARQGGAVWRVAALVVSFACLLLFLWYSWALIQAHRAAPPGADVPVIDFAVFHAAARLAAEGEWRTLFDRDALHAALHLRDGDPTRFPWLYMPGFLLILMPLGLLGFPAAWLAFNFGAMALWAWSASAAGLRWLSSRWTVILAPAALSATALGQNAMLSAAAYVAALHAVRQGRDGLAATLLALLTLKPQLGLLIPVALAAAGRWRLIGLTAGLAIAFHVVTTLPFGFDYWQMFLDTLAARGETESATAERASSAVSATVYTGLRLLGAGHGAAAIGQAVAALAAAALVFAAWRGSAPYPLKAGILLAATLLAAPYAYFYETLLPFAGAVWAKQAGFGARPAERIVLALLWVGPVPGMVWQDAGVALLWLPVLAAALALMARRAFGQAP